MKKTASKFAKPAQIQPKSQFLFHKNLPTRDFGQMTTWAAQLGPSAFLLFLGAPCYFWCSLTLPDALWCLLVLPMYSLVLFVAPYSFLALFCAPCCSLGGKYLLFVSSRSVKMRGFSILSLNKSVFIFQVLNVEMQNYDKQNIIVNFIIKKLKKTQFPQKV